MELLYNFPDALTPYFEYIPEDELREIITAALEQAISSRSTTYSGNSEQNAAYEKMLERISDMLSNISQVSATSAPVIHKPKPRPVADVPPPVEDAPTGDLSREDEFLADIFK